MNSKRARSADGAARPRNSANETRNTTTEVTPPMPAYDRAEPQRWLNALDLWFRATKITDSWIRYSIIATTQTAAEYAILNADVRMFPHNDPYEMARQHILRQNRRERSPARNSPAASDNESLILIEAGDGNQAAAAGNVVSSRSTPTSTPPNERVTAQSLHQLEEMLLGKIRELANDIAELQALFPSARRRPATSARAGRAINTPQIRSNPIDTPATEPCWYHQAYGHQARLCRAPCSFRLT